MKCKAGFGKTDLLVVLGCIVFLMANLGPVGSAGRRRAKEAVCLSNLLKWAVVWKSYTDDHGGYFPRRGRDWPDSMIAWPDTTRFYYKNPRLLFCPEATKTIDQGGVNPFMAWYHYIGEYERYYEGSYCVNLWVSNETGDHKGVVDGFWRTAGIKGAANVPLLLDGQWTDADPLHSDEPPEHEDDFWEPNINEMQRPCVNRHVGAVNAVFLDFAVRKIGLKQLWELPWHKNWNPDDYPPPLWPEWMQNFKNY